MLLCDWLWINEQVKVIILIIRKGTIHPTGPKPLERATLNDKEGRTHKVIRSKNGVSRAKESFCSSA